MGVAVDQKAVHARAVEAGEVDVDADPGPAGDAQLAAATSLAYNIGITAYCGSTADKRFDQRNFAGGCAGLKLWDKARVGGKLQTVRGLANRRADEYRLCMTGLS